MIIYPSLKNYKGFIIALCTAMYLMLWHLLLFKVEMQAITANVSDKFSLV
jgi:hypothetical protein